MSSSDIQYVDRPMDCCGLAQGHGFHYKIKTGKRVPEKRLARDPTTRLFIEKETGYFFDEVRDPTKADHLKRLEYLERQALEHGRSCVVISLADEDQEEAQQAALERGWKKIYTFHNWNSGNEVSLFSFELKLGNDDDEEEQE